MVIETSTAGIYLHAAWSTDENGSDFSLTFFDDAVYVGNYTSNSATESTDPNDYTWKVIGADAVDADDVEDYEELEPVGVAEVQDDVDSLEVKTDSLEAKTRLNDDNLQRTQHVTDQGLGNVNLLVGTNQGTTNWTTVNSTLTAVSTPIYTDDVNDAVNTVHIVLGAASDSLEFSASQLIDYINANSDENTFTLSYDMKVSNEDAIFTASLPGLLTFDAPSFTPDDPDDDFTGTWIHFVSTAELEGTTASGTNFVFGYTGTTGDTVDIANLKIEAAAYSTPWMASLEEIEGIANTALNEVRTVNQHFWSDANGAHITEVTQEQYITDPTTAGGNTLITSSGMDVRDGTTSLASFGITGAQVGQSGSGHTIISSNGMVVYGNDGTLKLAELAYGLGNTPGGAMANAPFFSFGERDGQIGNYSVAEGIGTIASGAHSHAEGEYTDATNYDAHAEGSNTVASGIASHAEGFGTVASGENAHAEGGVTEASGLDSHAQNSYTIAASDYQTALGRYNIADSSDTYAVIVGNGTRSNARSNALTVDWSGNVEANNITVADIDADAITGSNLTLTGTVTVGADPTSNMEVATKQYVDNAGGFSGSATSLTVRRTLGSSETSYVLNDSISSYKFLTFEFFNSNNYGRWTVPVSVFTLSTTAVENVVTRGGSTTRYAYIRYIDDTHVGVYCSIASGLNMYIYGIK